MEADCESCVKREECPLAAFGMFCTRYQSRVPEPEGEDPNELWRRGEDVDFS